MADLWRCTLCDDKIEETGRIGHLKFTDGDGHGTHKNFPDDYDDNVEDYFVLIDDDGQDHGSEGNEDSDTGNQSTPNEGQNSPTPNESPSEDGDTGNGKSTGTGGQTGVIAKVKKFLMSEI